MHDVTTPGAAFSLGATAIAVGVGATVAARATALRLGLVAAPNPIVPQHRRPVAYLGGAAIAAAGLALLVPYLAIAHPARPIVDDTIRVGLLSLGYLALGLLDDVRPLEPAVKLGLQVFVAMSVLFLGVVPSITGRTWLDDGIAIAWVVLVVNAFNVTDVCDGLVAGLAVVAFIAIALADVDLRVVGAVLAGATVGFLSLNRPPASVFLGDAGSHLLGAMVATCGLVYLRAAHDGAALTTVVLLAAVPLFEVVLLVVSRTSKGLAPWRPSPDHLALRLQARGLSRWATDAIAWTAAAVAFGVGVFAHLF